MKQRSNPLSWITVDDAELSVDQFPDGSFRFTVDYQGTYSNQVGPEFVVTLKSTLPEAIVAAYQVCGALIIAYPNGSVNLVVQTMPDQRADRMETPGMSIPAIMSAGLLGNIPCHTLTVYDLHSEVTRKALVSVCKEDGKELTINEPLPCFLEALNDYDIDPNMKVDHVVAVDKGAIERATEVANHFGAGVIVADKNRVDGKVIGHKLMSISHSINPTDTIWIVDDLCDGGATFISVAKLLREHYNFHELNLYVTHGLFSKGKDELFKYYTTILALFDYAKNS